MSAPAAIAAMVATAAPVVELERKAAPRPPDRWIAWFVVRAQEGAIITGFAMRNIDTGQCFGLGEPFPDAANPKPTRESCEQWGIDRAAGATEEFEKAGIPVVCEFVEPVREGVSL